MLVPAPNGSNPDKRLKPSIAGKDRRLIPIKLTITDFNLPKLKSSIDMAIIFSNTAITVDVAANDIKMKKIVAQSRPACMLAKTFGRVTKEK